MSADRIRQIVLETIAANRSRSIGPRTFVALVDEPLTREGLRDAPLALEIYYDLFRTGVLAWGLDFANPTMDYAHVTAHGRASLAQAGRDPSNPAGYRRAIEAWVPGGSIARSYVDEALETYVVGCEKASAVMLGAAAEALVVDLRDLVVSKLEASGVNVRKGLKAWQAKTMFEALAAELQQHIRRMPPDLADQFEAQASALAGQLRVARNDAGHPKSIAPVTREQVHGNLLLFLGLSKLLSELTTWVEVHFDEDP